MTSRLPVVNNCCGCVLDLKVAVAIIAILGIVTSPAISWAVVRHSYVIRMACYITSHEVQPDVVDINLHNVLTFGFGVNAGLEPSCFLKPNSTNNVSLEPKFHDSQFVNSVRWVGWLVLLADLIFVVICIKYLYRLFKPLSEAQQLRTVRQFMWACIFAILLSFIYGLLHVAACVVVGGSFPVFEFVFSFVDVILWAMWTYFIIVIRSYILQLKNTKVKTYQWDWYYYYSYIIELLYSKWISLKNALPELPRYLLSINILFCWFSVWVYFLIVVRSYSIKTYPSYLHNPRPAGGNPATSLRIV